MKKYFRVVILVISVITVFSGAMQIVAPAFVLHFVGVQIDDATKQLFATIGMFMFLFGCMMVHALYDVHDNRVVVIWSALQKLGASIAVGIGILYGIFALPAAGVALFDFYSGILFFYYLKSLKVE
jgi:tetrahydromethanopterin S-methyltransferase subunit G